MPLHPVLAEKLSVALGPAPPISQVCADLTSPLNRERELRAFRATHPEYPRASRRLLVLDRDGLSRIAVPGVEVMPAYEWLLA